MIKKQEIRNMITAAMACLIGFSAYARDFSQNDLYLNGSGQAGKTATNPYSYPQNPVDYKSPGKAFFLSLLLPGAGEFYAGSKNTAAVFLGSEMILWGSFAAFRTLSSWKSQDGIALAKGHAGIDMTGRDYNYYVAVENFMTIRAYNEAKLRQRDLDAMYPEDEYHSWEWDSDASRRKFESLRIQSDKWKNRSVLIIGAVLLNHIVSGIDAARLAAKHNSGLEQPVHVHASALPEGGAVITFSKRF